MWIIGQKIFSDKNILPIKTANIFGKQYFTNKHVLAGYIAATVNIRIVPAALRNCTFVQLDVGRQFLQEKTLNLQ
jgi:propanediol dehydratase small subunit